jgi:cyclopropane fatty-acyl-phospholipid synthase-like methyltransferase
MSSHELSAVSVPIAPSGAALQPDAVWHELQRGTSERYRSSGSFALHFARGKLAHDPVFRALLERSAIGAGARVLDIGCGQALLASLLAQCDALAAGGRWPAAWGAAPCGACYTGIDLMSRDIQRAERALAALPQRPQLLCGDMRRVAFEACDVAIALDVLHYVERTAQDEMLQRIRAALAPRGRLLLRVGDASQRWRFAVSQWVDRAVTLSRGHAVPPTWGRPLSSWQAALQELGFAVHAVPMSRGTPFANVLLLCELEAQPR